MTLVADILPALAAQLCCQLAVFVSYWVRTSRGRGDAYPYGAALLVGLILLVYGNSLSGSFHYDDFHSIVHNPYIRDLGNIPSFFADPKMFSGDPDKAMYRPLLLVTYALNHAFGRYQLLGYHLVNLGLHLGCVLLVRRMALLAGAGERAALVAGLLFGLHPLATEPVSYISSRSESLAACLYLGALAAYASPAALGYWLALVCFALGLLSKEVVVTLPLVLLLYDWWVKGEQPRLRRHLPFCGLAAAYLVVIWANAALGGGLARAPRALDVQAWTQAKALVYYLVLAGMPVGLNVEHQFAEAVSVWQGPVAASVLLLGTGGLLLWTMAPRRHLFWLAWALICLAPASLVPLNVLVNEHRLYLPLAGLAVLAARGLGRTHSRLVWPAVAILGVLSFQRNQVWKDEMSLWQDALAKSPQMPRVHVHLGNAWREQGRVAEAQQAYAAALRLDPAHRAARTNLGNLYYEAAEHQADTTLARPQYALAAREYQQVLDLDPGYKEALNNLGSVYRMLGKDAEADAAYRRLVQAYPNFAEGYFNLAQTRAKQGDPAAASELYRQGLALQPDAQACYELGNAEASRGELAAAAAAYRQACELDATRPVSFYNRGEVLLALGQQAQIRGRTAEARELWQEATQCYSRVLALEPGNARAASQLRQLTERTR